MADQTKELQLVVTMKDEATKALQSFGSSFKDLADSAVAGSAVIVGALGLIGKTMIETGMNMETARISFETFLGSGQKAGKLLKDLSDFAARTPFDLPQVIEGSKQLLAFGVSADKLIPTLKTLGDISAGVGSEKLPQLIHAFGQVSAGTILSGRELNEFVMAGVPLLDKLAEMYSKTGIAASGMGVATVKNSAKSAELTEKISILNQKMSEHKEKYAAGTVAYREAELQLGKLKGQLDKAGASTTSFGGSAVVTAAQVKDMISNGEVSFNDVQKALTSMTDKGGRFYDLMAKLSKTLTGVLSNTRDEFIRFSLAVLGFTENAEIRKGSIFFYLKEGAELMLTTLTAVRPYIQQFVDTVVNNGPAVAAVLGALGGLLLPLVISFAALIAPALLFAAAGAAIGAAIGYVIANFQALQPYLVALLGIIIGIAVVAIPPLIAAFVAWSAAAVTAGIATVVALAPVIATVALIAAAVVLLWGAWSTNFLGIRDITSSFVDWFSKIAMPTFIDNFNTLKKVVTDLAVIWRDNFNIIHNIFTTETGFVQAIGKTWEGVFNNIKSAINAAADAINNLVNNARFLANQVKGGLKIPGFQHGGFVPGAYGQAVPAILHGGERVIPRNGVDVNSGGNSGGGGGVTINISGSFSLDSEDRIDQLVDRINQVIGRQNELAAKGVGF